MPIYNVPGLTTDLKFTGTLLADIFLGKVTKWNDPAIAQVNAGVTLPNADIIVVHRSDGSGTTYIFADYLAKVSPEWKSKVGVNTAAQLADRRRRQGQRGRDGTGEADARRHRLRRADLRAEEQDRLRLGREQGQEVRQGVDRNASRRRRRPRPSRCRPTSACRSPTPPATRRIRSRPSPGCCSTRTRRTRRRRRRWSTS